MTSTLPLDSMDCWLKIRCRSHEELRNERPFPFPVERPLILQPSPVALHTRHLLPVVVRYRIIRTRAPRVDPMLLDPLKERPLFLHEFHDLAPVERPPDCIAEEGADEPAEERGGEGGDAHRDEGVGGDGFGDYVGDGGGDRDGGAAADEGEEGGDDGGGEGVAPAGLAEFEEGVPV